MRHTTGRLLIRSILDIRLSRLSMLALGAVSVAATLFILAGGSGRSNAQVAALAALHQRPVTVVQAAPPAPAAAAGASSDAGAGSSAGGGGNSSSVSAGSDAPASSSASGSDSSAASDASSGAGATSDAGGGTDTSTTSATTTSSSTTSTSSTLPTVRHVFEIVLSTPSYATAFGRGSAAPYLRSLESKATLLSGYESLGEGELADELALVGGQAPNADTRTGCTTYAEFPQGTAAKANGAVPGTGCVYPESALTLGDQVTASGHTWRAYISDMGTSTCVHPNSNAVDDVALPGAGPGYDTRHNPFIYFHSLLDLGDCATNDVDLTHLDKALATRARTATYSFISPGVCADATAVAGPSPSPGPADGTSTTSTTTTTSPATTTTTTSTTTSSTAAATSTTSTPSTSTATPAPSTTASACAADAPVGIAAEDAFLKQWVPRILASPGYGADGVLVIAFAGDAARNPGHPIRTGALVISRHAHAHRTLSTAYGPYSLLRSVEDMLGDAGLAHAKSAPSFAAKVLGRN